MLRVRVRGVCLEILLTFDSAKRKVSGVKSGVNMVSSHLCFCNDSAWLFDVPSIGLFYLSWLRDDTRRVD